MKTKCRQCGIENDNLLYHDILKTLGKLLKELKKEGGKMKKKKGFEIPESIVSEPYMLGLDIPSIKKEQDIKWETLKCKSGANYQWVYDDHCIAVKVKDRIIWLELQALQFFEAELFLKEIGV